MPTKKNGGARKNYESEEEVLPKRKSTRSIQPVVKYGFGSEEDDIDHKSNGTNHYKRLKQTSSSSSAAAAMNVVPEYTAEESSEYINKLLQYLRDLHSLHYQLLRISFKQAREIKALSKNTIVTEYDIGAAPVSTNNADQNSQPKTESEIAQTFAKLVHQYNTSARYVKTSLTPALIKIQDQILAKDQKIAQLEADVQDKSNIISARDHELWFLKQEQLNNEREISALQGGNINDDLEFDDGFLRTLATLDSQLFAPAAVNNGYQSQTQNDATLKAENLELRKSLLEAQQEIIDLKAKLARASTQATDAELKAEIIELRKSLQEAQALNTDFKAKLAKSAAHFANTFPKIIAKLDPVVSHLQEVADGKARLNITVLGPIKAANEYAKGYEKKLDDLRTARTLQKLAANRASTTQSEIIPPSPTLIYQYPAQVPSIFALANSASSSNLSAAEGLVNIGYVPESKVNLKNKV